MKLKMNKAVLAVAVMAGLVVVSGSVHAEHMIPFGGIGAAVGDGRGAQVTLVEGLRADQLLDTHTIVSLAIDARVLLSNSAHSNVGNVGLVAFLDDPDLKFTPFTRVSRGGTGTGVGVGAVVLLGNSGFAASGEFNAYSSLDGKPAGITSVSILHQF